PLFFLSRDLLSFPTRRSSDLNRLSSVLSGPFYDLRVDFILRAGPAIVNSPRSRYLPQPKGLNQFLTHRRSPFFCIQQSPLPMIKDRKSTRLNSSHRTISYAVF